MFFFGRPSPAGKTWNEGRSIIIINIIIIIKNYRLKIYFDIGPKNKKP